ncbi:hypothetical protein [Paenibacillus favisporus]
MNQWILRHTFLLFNDSFTFVTWIGTSCTKAKAGFPNVLQTIVKA